MNGVNDSVGIICDRIAQRLAEGLVPDDDVISFIESTYGLSGSDDISRLFAEGDDSGAVIDLLSYPDEKFRISIEPIIPATGFTKEEVEALQKKLDDSRIEVNIKYQGSLFVIDPAGSSYCVNRFIQRLNLDVTFDYLEISGAAFSSGLFMIRGLLRRQGFFSNEECSIFINDLVNRFDPVMHGNFEELAELVKISAGFFKGSEHKPYDILAGKKFYYERAVDEQMEFSRMMKTYSMEFMMMKRLQPPLVTLEEARNILRRIDTMTSVVYRMIIPSVIVTHYNNDTQLF